MINPKIVDDFAEQFTRSLPPGLGALKSEVEQAARTALQGLLSKLNLVGREEFDIQTAVLLRTREKLEALERQLQQLEEKHLK